MFVILDSEGKPRERFDTFSGVCCRAGYTRRNLIRWQESTGELRLLVWHSGDAARLTGETSTDGFHDAVWVEGHRTGTPLVVSDRVVKLYEIAAARDLALLKAGTPQERLILASLRGER